MPEIVTEPAQEQNNEGEEEKKDSAPAPKAVVGIIYPPPEVRSIRLRNSHYRTFNQLYE